MSTPSVDNLIEEAKELAEGYFNGTTMAAFLTEAYVMRDYDQLRHLVKWANDIIFDQEYKPNEVDANVPF